MSKKNFTHHFYGIKGGGGGGGGFRPLNLERPILINGLRGKVRTRPDIFGGRFGSRPILGQKLAIWPNVLRYGVQLCFAHHLPCE